MNQYRAWKGDANLYNFVLETFWTREYQIFCETQATKLSITDILWYCEYNKQENKY